MRWTNVSVNRGVKGPPLHVTTSLTSNSVRFVLSSLYSSISSRTTSLSNLHQNGTPNWLTFMPYDLIYISIPVEILKSIWTILQDHTRPPGSIAMHSPQWCPFCELYYSGPTFSRSPARFSSKSSGTSIRSRVNRDLRPRARSSQFCSYSCKYYLPSRRVRFPRSFLIKRSYCFDFSKFWAVTA